MISAPRDGPATRIAAKETWAKAGRLIDAAPAPVSRRLPPGQTLRRDWPVLDLGTQPNPGLSDWRLVVGGMVARPVQWRWADVLRQTSADSTSDIHCVAGWSRFDNEWRGVPVRWLLAQVRPKPAARFALIKGLDGYGTCLALGDLAAEGALLATHWQDEPLSRSHGGPLRLVVPHLYFWKSAKWLRQIWLTDRYAHGTWESRGYHHRGDPWQQQRYGRS